MNWKILAIVSVILNVMVIGIFITFWSLGTDIIEKENECVYNLCKGYDSYFFDEYESTCYCYAEGKPDFVTYIR